MSSVIDDAMAHTELAKDDPERHGGTSTGFRDIDRHIGRLHPGDFCVLAARPAMGKTALLLQICQHICSEGANPLPVGLFSCEMPSEQLGRRSLSGEARVSSLDMKTGHLRDADVEAVRRAHRALRPQLQNLYVDDEGGLRVSQVVIRARRLQQQVGQLGLIAVDYLQLLAAERELLRANRDTQVGHMSKTLKALAKELECPVLALSQLNRGVEMRQDKRPIMSDLRESGSIEQDADSILLLYRGEYYWPEDQKLRNKAEVIVAKARGGKPGVVDLNFYPYLTRFTDFTTDQLRFGGGE